MKIKFYFLDKIKRRQTPIYSALIDLDFSVPTVRSISIPSIPETISDNGISANKWGGVANLPGSYYCQAHALGAPRATKVSVSEVDAGLPTLPSAAALIRLARASHNFGEVLVGDYEYWILTLANEGENEGIISDVSGLPLDGFSLVEQPGLPFTIPPHGTWVITVQYAPDQVGNKSVVCLPITTNDLDYPIQRVLLTGTGVTTPRNDV